MQRSTFKYSSAQGCLLWAALALAIGLSGSGSRSLWYDEVYVLMVARSDTGDALSAFASDGGNMWLYFASMWVRDHVVPFSPLLFRVPSVLAFGALVASTWRLARSLGSNRSAGWSAGLAVSSSALVWHGQEARSYIFVALAAVLLVEAWFTFLDDGGGWRLAAAASVGVFGASLHLTFLVFGACVLVVTATESIRALRAEPAERILAIGVSGAVLLVPLLLMAADNQGQNITWVPALDATQLAGIVGFAVGGQKGIQRSVVLALLPIAVRSAIWGWSLIVQARADAADRNRRAMQLHGIAALFLLALLVISLRMPLTLPRYFIPALPLLCVAIPASVARQRAANWVLAAAVALSAPRALFIYGEQEIDYRGIAVWIEANAPSDLPLASDHRSIALGIQVELARLDSTRPVGSSSTPVDLPDLNDLRRDSFTNLPAVLATMHPSPEQIDDSVRQTVIDGVYVLILE